MLRTAKATLASARHQGSRIASTLGSVPKPHIDTRLVKDALRRGKHRDQRTTVHEVSEPSTLTTTSPLATEVTHDQHNHALETKYGFGVLQRMPATDELTHFRSRLAAVLPQLDQVGASYNAAVDAKAPERFRLLVKTYVLLHSIQQSTAEYAAHAEDALDSKDYKVSSQQVTALSKVQDEISAELDKLWAAIKANQHEMKKSDFDI